MADGLTNFNLFALSLLLLVCIDMVCGIEPRGEELVFTVEHCLSEEADAVFKPRYTDSQSVEIENRRGYRGTIYVKTVKSSTGTISQTEPLSLDEVENLKDLALKDGYYRIRLRPKSMDGGVGSDSSVSTFVKACSLFTSKLTETITLTLDNTGHLYGVGLIVPDGGCQAKTLNWDAVSLPSQFNSSVAVMLQGTGQLPDTQTYIQRLEKEKREKQAGKTQDNRSFLAKYWMYIVPVVIFMMLTSQQPEQQEGSSQ